jgi:hypothetical protein
MSNMMDSVETATPDSGQTNPAHRLPVEVSLSIIAAGVVGLIVPGPFGAPLIVGGGLSLWPRTFEPVDRWVRKKMPRAHESGMNWLDRFRNDLEHRYPHEFADGSKREPSSPTPGHETGTHRHE